MLMNAKMIVLTILSVILLLENSCLITCYYHLQHHNHHYRSNVKSYAVPSSPSPSSSSEKSMQSSAKSAISNIVKPIVISLGIGIKNSFAATTAAAVLATDTKLDGIINSDVYKKAPISIQSDDFWYPPYMIGRWNTSMKFTGARFTDEIPLDILAQNNNLPGFTKYSVMFVPDIGKDIRDLELRYIQLDSHPREDHPYNIRHIFQSFLPNDAVVDSAPYSFQKAPDWFHSPANNWRITYHDNKGNGTIQITTQKRNITVTAGTVETIEFFKQVHSRQLYNSSRISTVRSDYALNYKLLVPASSRDEFVTVEELAKSNTIIGTLSVLAYFQPTNELYMKIPGKPAGVYTYDIVMNRLGTDDIQEEIKRSQYPFIWRDDGPIELDKYFGY